MPGLRFGVAALLFIGIAAGLERLRLRGVAGALLALAGIAWMAAGPEDVLLPLGALTAMAAAAVCAGQSIIMGKRVSANHPAMTNAVRMTVGAVLLLAFSVLIGETWAIPRQADAVWGVVYLVSLGSVGLFVLVLLVVRRWTASATSYMFVLFPVATMALGAWIADGAAFVMAGVWFGALSPGGQTQWRLSCRAGAVSPHVTKEVTRGGLWEDSQCCPRMRVNPGPVGSRSGERQMSGSTAGFPQRRKVRAMRLTTGQPMASYSPSRSCEHPSCVTQLSRYNPAPVCGAHGGWLAGERTRSRSA